MRITGVAPILTVANLDNSLRYFKDILGFTEDFRGHVYAIVQRDDISIHLSLNAQSTPPGTGTVYIFCDEVDSYYDQLVARQALLDTPPADLPYGMRDFVVYDPDKNKLFFGCPIKTP